MCDEYVVCFDYIWSFSIDRVENISIQGDAKKGNNTLNDHVPLNCHIDSVEKEIFEQSIRIQGFSYFNTDILLIINLIIKGQTTYHVCPGWIMLIILVAD